MKKIDPNSDLRFLSWPVDRIQLNRGVSIHLKHEGLDLGGSRGSVIRAAHDGVVSYSGQKYRGYGKVVVIKFNEIWSSWYAHLDSFLVKKGQVIQRGDVIGLMGDTGRASGVHLHFELRKKQKAVNPLDYLPKIN